MRPRGATAMPATAEERGELALAARDEQRFVQALGDVGRERQQLASARNRAAALKSASLTE